MIGQTWRSLSLRAKGLIVSLIPLVALLLSSFLFYTVGQQEQEAQKWVDHSFEVRDQIHLAQTQLEESETRLRGYLLVGNQDSLQLSLSAQRELAKTVEDLKTLVSDNQLQTARAKRIDSLVAAKNRQSQDTVTNFRTLSQRGMLGANVEASHVLLDSLRDEFEAMRREEEKILTDRVSGVKKAKTLAGIVIATGALFGVFGGLAASILFTLGLDNRVKKLDLMARELAQGNPIPVSVANGFDTISSLERELGRASSLLIERQNNLGETNDYLNHLISSMPGVLVRLDKDFRVLYASPNAPRVFGYKTEEMLSDSDFYSRTLHPEDRNEVMVSLTRAIIEKLPLIETERRVLHKSGEYHWMHSYVRPEYDEDGQVTNLLSYSVDVTELKRTQQALRESETLFRNSFDLAPIGIMLMTQEGKWLMVNRAMFDIMGYSEADFMQTTLQGITHPDDFKTYFDLLKDILGEKINSAQMESRYIHADGHIVWVQIHVSLVRDAEGKPLYFIGQVQDISERKRIDVELAQARDAALESARAKANFMANMSHEIRTPMNGIFGMIGLLGNTRLEAQQRDFVDTMRESADALLVIVNDILDFSKIEAGKMEMENANFDLNVTVESSVGLLAAKSRTRSIELGSIIYREVPTLLRGDAGRLRQILLNLLDNAIKFTPDGGDAMLRVTRENESENVVVLNFAISDSGIGIDEEAQLRLFQPFAQADGSTTRRYGGTGLGLAICKQLVELMGGKIGVRSQKGEGSTFWFTACFEKQLNIAALAAREKADMSLCRVLIIDSSSSHRHLVHQQVVSWNFSSDSVARGADALEILHREVKRGNPYHIVLVSRQLDDMDALSLVRAIRTLPLISETRLIVMTQPEDNVQDIRVAGADDVLVKPIRQSQLFNSLTEVMESRKSNALPSYLAEKDLPPAPKINGDPLHILVAEDNAINQKVVLNQLRNLGHSSVIVNTGLEALKAWKENSFDLILMDCHMPEMDGYTAAREIRAQEASNHHIPIIALTANALDGDRELCIAAGMDDYLPKPVNQVDLDKMLLRMSVDRQIGVAAESGHLIPVLQVDRIEQLRSELSPDLFQSLLEMFIQEVPQLIEELNLAISNKDSFQIGEIAHKLRGSCGTLGAKQISDLCEKIQQYAESNQLNEIPTLRDRIEAEFEPVKIALNRYMTNESHSSSSHAISEFKN